MLTSVSSSRNSFPVKVIKLPSKTAIPFQMGVFAFLLRTDTIRCIVESFLICEDKRMQSIKSIQPEKSHSILNSNALKLIAILAMTADHCRRRPVLS